MIDNMYSSDWRPGASTNIYNLRKGLTFTLLHQDECPWVCDVGLDTTGIRPTFRVIIELCYHLELRLMQDG